MIRLGGTVGSWRPGSNPRPCENFSIKLIIKMLWNVADFSEIEFFMFETQLYSQYRYRCL